MNKLLIIALFLTPSIASAGLTLKSGKTSFSTTGPGGFVLEGESKKLALADSGGNLVFTVPVKSVDTGIGLRNKHMRDKYVKVAQNPDAVLSVPRAGLELEGGEGTTKGTFTLSGVSKEVDVKYKIAKSGKVYVVEGSFAFDVRDHGITIPSYAGITVDPKMKAHAQIQAIDE